MGYKKKFKVNTDGVLSPISGANHNNIGSTNFNYRNWGSNLPDVYTGHPNRVERYNQYEAMDMDPEINAALDIIAEFSTQNAADTEIALSVHFNEKGSPTETEILNDQLKKWYNLQDFDIRITKLFRNVCKYGDQVFIRDPETFELYWVDMQKVTKVVVNESEGKTPEKYFIRDIDVNFESLTATNPTSSGQTYTQAPHVGGNQSYGTSNNPYTTASRFSADAGESEIDAQHIIHFSLTEGLDANWPFGMSILETVFKVYKQKELLEDAILIYRVQRAPERRVFYIDTGTMPSHLAMQFVERVKNEIHQRRIPTQTGGGTSVMDATYNPLCLDLETKIPLLDGRTLSLNEIIKEFNVGKENWAYSCNPETGKVVPGVINWAGVTRRDTEVIKLTFDNGKTLTCTPDHKIPVFGKGFVEAKDLTENDSLIAFNTRNKSISGGKTNDYQQVWDHEEKKWVWTHRLVGEFFRKQNKHQEFTFLNENIGKEKTVIHHADYNRFNNDPRNLQYMNKNDHVLYHSSQKGNFWGNLSESELDSIKSKISNSVKANWKSMSENERASALYNIRKAQKKSVWMRQNDPDTMKSYAKNARQSRLEYFKNNPEFLEQCKRNLESRVKIKNQDLNLTFEMLQIVADYVKDGHTNKNEVISLCDNNEYLLNIVANANSESMDYKNSHCKIDFTRFGYSKLDKLLSMYNYKNWKTFVKEIDNFNHKIVKIEKVSNRDTGTITIDGNERWHDYHTFAIESGIFVKNSINEDYFFPQTAEGRGSKVETLPGGENLGQIDDLKFFNNKLLRGLRVPSSYLPTGPDDGSQAYTDGRVTTALIQEQRFNEYCIHLQKLVQTTLDREFKTFLAWRGFNIDNSLFEIRLSEPLNFSSYRDIDLNAARIGNFGGVDGVEYLSKRFILKKYLGLTDTEIEENEKMLLEERGESPDDQAEGADLRNVGISTGDISGDIDMLDGIEGDMSDGDPGVDDMGNGMPTADVDAPPTASDMAANTQSGFPGGTPGGMGGAGGGGGL